MPNQRLASQDDKTLVIGIAVIVAIIWIVSAAIH